MSDPSNNSFLDEDPFFSDLLSSQADIEDQILLLEEALSSDRCIEEKFEEIQNFLSSSSIKNLTVDILDEKVFNVTLPGTQKLYFEVIRSIDEKLKSKTGNGDDIRNQLNLVINMLKCWDVCIDHIKTLEKISIINVKSFPTSLFEVFVDALNHCKTSSENYGDYFQAVSDCITTIFRQCVATLNSFYALLDTVISFDTNEVDEMNILLKIIDETGKIATMVSGMDAKTMTDMWKQFGKLSTNYCLQMKELSPSTITYHFKGLSENILSVLSSITQKSQQNVNGRSILCSRLLLKILEKLSSVYCGWIRNEIMAEIIVMLTILFKYSEQCLKISSYSAEFIKFIVTNLAFMIEPFVDVISKNDSFKIAFFEHVKNVDIDCIGFHLLTLTLVKKLSMLEYESQQEWCTEEKSILDVCFQNIDKLTKDIYVSKLEIQMSREVSQGSYLANIYEATCVSVFSLICQVSPSDFEGLISLLLKYLMGGKFFSSLLSTDVWCFICRLGSSETCYSMFKFLWQVYESLDQREDNMNFHVLSNLLCRQFGYLADNDKADFMTNITCAMKVHQWRLIGRMLDTQRKKQIQQQVDAASINSRISVDLKNFEEQRSVRSMNVLIKDLCILQACGMPQDEKSSETFVKMWNKIVHLLGDCEGASLRTLEILAIAVLGATLPAPGNAKYMTTILQSMISLYPYASSELHLEFCRLLNRCAEQLTENDVGVIVDLYTRLLVESETCIQQEAFESFDNLTRECPNTNLLTLLAMTIKNAKSEISKTLPAYITNNMIHKIVGFANTEEVIEAFFSLVDKHVCRTRNSVEREEKVFKMDDSFDWDDVDKRAEKLCADMEQLMKLRKQIKRDTCDRLRNVCQRFLDMDR